MSFSALDDRRHDVFVAVDILGFLHLRIAREIPYIRRNIHRQGNCILPFPDGRFGDAHSGDVTVARQFSRIVEEREIDIVIVELDRVHKGRQIAADVGEHTRVEETLEVVRDLTFVSASPASI